MEALAGSAALFPGALQNVEILVDDWLEPEISITRAGAGYHLLLGLYHGVPLTERTSSYLLVPPDTITLYQGPLSDQRRRLCAHSRAGKTHGYP